MIEIGTRLRPGSDTPAQRHKPSSDGGVSRQNRRYLFARNPLGYAGKLQRRIVSGWVGTAFTQDAAAACKQLRELADQAQLRVPNLATFMDDAEADVLADIGLPVQHRAKLHSTNVPERFNGDINRRSDVVGILPDGEWAVQRACDIGLETVASLRDNLAGSLPPLAA